MNPKNLFQSLLKNSWYLFLLLLLSPSILATPLDDLINSYDYSFSDGTFAEILTADFMSDKNSDGRNDTLFINITTDALDLSYYVFLIELSNSQTNYATASKVLVYWESPFAVVSIPTENIAGNQWNYSIKIFDPAQNLLYRRYGIQTRHYPTYDTVFTILSVKDYTVANNSIILNITANSSKTAKKNITAILEFQNSSISSTIENSFTAGVKSFLISFDNETIKKTHYTGNFSVESVRIDQRKFVINKPTAHYSFEDFAKTSYITAVQSVAVDTDANGFYDSLKIPITIAVKEAGLYTVSYDVLDASGIFIETVISNGSLSQGIRELSSIIDGKIISAAKHDGPYTISNLALTKDGVLYDSMLTAHTTAQFVSSDFEPPPRSDLTVSLQTVYDNATQQTVITAIVQNIGSAPAFSIELEIFDNETFTNSSRIPFLSAGEFTTRIINSSSSSDAVVTAMVDFSDTIDETNEENNIVQSNGLFSVTKPILFTVKNHTKNLVAILTSEGTFTITGQLYPETLHSSNDDVFVVRNKGKNLMAISPAGDAYLLGRMFENQAIIPPSYISSDFVIKNAEKQVVFRVNGSGDLFLKGELKAGGE